jgi:histidyl-tRNA synthetase
VLLDALNDLSSEIDPAAMTRYAQNPLRIFDSKEYGDALKEKLPVISDYLVEEDAAHFARVRESLQAVAVGYREDPFLVRGLDYYTRTVIEVYHCEPGAQSALCGGGRYDALIAECGGPDTPAIGFSVGLERVVDALPAREVDQARAPLAYYVVVVGDGAEARGLRAAQTLRAFGAAQADLSGRSRKKQLEAAMKSGARVAVVVDESNAGAVEWHELGNRTETTVGDDRIAAHARERAGQGDNS